LFFVTAASVAFSVSQSTSSDILDSLPFLHYSIL
jgi:hypothetical protein